MSKLSSVCLCLILFLSIGCTSDNSDTQPDIIPTIEDEFNVQLWEHLTPNGSAFSLLVETIDDQDCLNSVIMNEVSIQPSNLVVNLNGIEHPENCMEGAAPAIADVSFANLANGNYDLEINILSLIKNNGFIEVSPGAIKIELISHDGLHISNNEIFRVPNNTYWGYIALDKVNLAAVSSSFLEEIEILQDDHSFVDGNYGHFKISGDNNTVDFDVTTAFPDHDKFVFKYSGDLDELTKVIDDFREDTAIQNDIEIRVMTYQGLEL